jgi:hypothetical protein
MIDIDVLIYYPYKFQSVDDHLQKDLFVSMLETTITCHMHTLGFYIL